MYNYLTTEEVAKHLKVSVEDVTSLVEQGKLPALRIGDQIRIRETALDCLETACAAVPAQLEQVHRRPRELTEPLAPGVRLCPTRTGKLFRVNGTVVTGAKIWPGQMRSPIEFPKQFMESLLVHFHNQEVPVGGKFDDAGRGTLGEFIQKKLRIKMNPAVYIAALLIEEGYAEESRRGYIRFRPEHKSRPLVRSAR